ncbi:MAG: hypothetical protein ACJ78Q_18675 [Chloroflexia bacterium]
MINSTHETSDAPSEDDLSLCWFCEQQPNAVCKCGRPYCGAHSHSGHCLVCALGEGLFEGESEVEFLSGLIIVSLGAVANDPYIVKPAALQYVRPLSISGVERLVGVLVRMLQGGDSAVRHKAASVLAATTNSLPSMNPSALVDHQHGTSLLAVDQVRRWLLYVLKLSRNSGNESTALAILDKLRTADFRDLYPEIQDRFTVLACSNAGTRVVEVFGALEAYYPTRNPMANERCELIAYQQYTNPARGAGKSMERIYGPRLKYSVTLSKMLKKGTWLSSQARFEEWYSGEQEPD